MADLRITAEVATTNVIHTRVCTFMRVYCLLTIVISLLEKFGLVAEILVLAIKVEWLGLHLLATLVRRQPLLFLIARDLCWIILL